MEYKHLKTGSSMISWRASARKRVFSVSLRFAPFVLPVFMGWGKRQISLISPWLASVNFTKFRIPPPLSFELKTMSRIFPCPGAEKPIHPLVFPDIFPWLARGPTPGASRWHVHNFCTYCLNFERNTSYSATRFTVATQQTFLQVRS